MRHKSLGAGAPAFCGTICRRQALKWGLAALAGAGCGVQCPAMADGTQITNATNALGEWATAWGPQFDPSRFLVSEKLDGVRAIWDGAVLRFRSGRPIVAPPWFVASLPPQPLDGELWLGRQTFDRLSATVRKTQPVDTDWRALRYMLFDMPSSDLPFEARSRQLETLVRQADLPWLAAVEQSRVGSSEDLQSRLQQVATLGGEGLVLHRTDALWQPGRSEAVRKLKLQPDDEATVVAHVPGKRKLEGQMGALLLEMPSGQRFSLGTGFSAADRANPPPIGAQVTYRYRDHTPGGLPKFATFVRVRAAE